MRGRLGWHDAATSPARPGGRRRGGALRARAGARDRRAVLRGAAPPGGGPHTVQVVRTVPERIYRVPAHGDFRILEATCARCGARAGSSTSRASSCGRRRSSRSWRTSCADPPTDDFRLLVLLPAHPNNGADRHTRAARSASRRPTTAAGRFLAVTIHSRTGELSGPLYVHAKVGHRRRRLAHGRLREPQRPLAVQRHRGERRHLRRGPRPRDAPAALERAPRAAGRSRVGRPRGVIDELWRPIASEQLQRRRRGDRRDPPADRAAGRVAPLQGAARTARRSSRRRLSAGRRYPVTTRGA